jgi:molybdate transport system substrate-binding protein
VPGGRHAQSVADGQAALVLVVISAVEPVPGVELLGPLPAELQHYVGYTGGVGAAAKEAKASKAFIEFLRAPAAEPVLKAKGMEPISP